MDHVNNILVLLIGLLCAVAAVAGLARRFAVSYPIVLVIFGLLCSLLPHVPRIPLPPSVVFLVILPPLLYIAAWQTSWREFKYNLVSISSLAFFLVFFTAVGVAFAAQWWLSYACLSSPNATQDTAKRGRQDTCCYRRPSTSSVSAENRRTVKMKLTFTTICSTIPSTRLQKSIGAGPMEAFRKIR